MTESTKPQVLVVSRTPDTAELILKAGRGKWDVVSAVSPEEVRNQLAGNQNIRVAVVDGDRVRAFEVFDAIKEARFVIAISMLSTVEVENANKLVRAQGIEVLYKPFSTSSDGPLVQYIESAINAPNTPRQKPSPNGSTCTSG
ncbi:MAG: hypothetical protein SFW62_09690 [Alphaproteobacteria bacterium]|nr:hypothetical protein [Alphaproteobacteria bacterium]